MRMSGCAGQSSLFLRGDLERCEGKNERCAGRLEGWQIRSIDRRDWCMFLPLLRVEEIGVIGGDDEVLWLPCVESES